MLFRIYPHESKGNNSQLEKWQDKMHKTENCSKMFLRKWFLISKDIFNLYFNSFFFYILGNWDEGFKTCTSVLKIIQILFGRKFSQVQRVITRSFYHSCQHPLFICFKWWRKRQVGRRISFRKMIAKHLLRLWNTLQRISSFFLMYLACIFFQINYYRWHQQCFPQ